MAFKAICGRIMLPLLAAVLLQLGGCATASLNLSKEELNNIRVQRVDVVYAPDAQVMWEKAELEYIAVVDARDSKTSKPKPWKQVMPEDIEAQKNRYQDLVNSPEGKNFIRGKLTGEIQARLQQSLSGRFQGTRPVVVEVTVHGFVIPSAAQRVVLGGSPMLGAVTVVKDAQSGAVLAKLDRMAAAPAGNGVLGVLVDQALPDLEDRLFGSYQTQVLEWLQAA